MRFSTNQYEFSHGKRPRGFGMWAFEVKGHDIFFTPPCTYTEAKRHAVRHFRSRGVDRHSLIITLP